MTLTHEQLVEIIRREVPNARLCVGEEGYTAPRLEWVLGAFYSRLFIPWCKQNKMDAGRDKIHMLYAAFAQIYQANLRILDKKNGTHPPLTIGTLLHGKDVAKNFVVDNEKNFYVIDPNTGKRLPPAWSREDVWCVTCNV